MGALAALGFEIIIGGILFAIFSIIGLFFSDIILFDSLALAVASGFISHGLLHIHPALSILIGIAVFAASFLLQKTKVGFWIFAVILSLFWGLVFSSMAYEFSGKDMIWTYVTLGLGTLLVIGLHIRAKNKI